MNYLDNKDEEKEDERYRIEKIFKMARSEKSGMKWCVALHLLRKSGFSVCLEDELKKFSVYTAPTGLIVKQANADANKFKQLKYKDFSSYSWKGSCEWRFTDFGMNKEEDFNENSN